MTPRNIDFAALQDVISGGVLLPGSEEYETARTPPTARFQDVLPQAVVQCRSATDVAETVAFVRRGGGRLAIRSGGHCFAGRSSTTGVLIDVSPMRSVVSADGIANVAAGATLGDVYDALDTHGLTLAGGCGPSVGIAGLTLGGGLGILGRKHGLTCDELVSAEVVLADGRVMTCDEERENDLFWALRGAGCGRFGVVTALTFKTLPAPAATSLHLSWPATNLPALINAWQEWSPAAPDELAASLLAIAGSDPTEPPQVHVFGAMLASKADTSELLEALIGRVDVEPASAQLEHGPYRQIKRYLAEHGPADDLPGPTQAAHAYSKSEFFRRFLPTDAITALATHLEEHRTPGHRRTLDFTPWAGAYNRVAHATTAFPHRAERFLLKHDVSIDAAAPREERRRALGWLARSWELVHPWGSGGVYPNFPDPELDDPAAAYFGTNRKRLQRIKAAYDPGNLFDFDV
jgi:FAD/FMN-containing dehydrogenase